MIEISIPTGRRRELVDITDDITAAIDGRSGLWHVYVPHTTAGITVNEGADPDVARDLLMAWEHIVDEDLPYAHAEGNSPAHILTSLVGSSVLVRFDGGRPALGTWQRVFFCEFDGPRRRKAWLTPISA